jgi:tartrate dehydrogenase/decarboxylase/D-malate dehydrogenase
MMLEHLGEPEAGAAVLHALESVLAAPERCLTPDLGGRATISELGRAIANAI